MACGYQMATHSFAKNLAKQIPELAGAEISFNWQFAEELKTITSAEGDDALLESLQQGSKVD